MAYLVLFLVLLLVVADTEGSAPKYGLEYKDRISALYSTIRHNKYDRRTNNRKTKIKSTEQLEQGLDKLDLF